MEDDHERPVTGPSGTLTDRAAEARLQAEQTRRRYRLAGEELAEDSARIDAAVKGRRGPGEESAT